MSDENEKVDGVETETPVEENVEEVTEEVAETTE